MNFLVVGLMTLAACNARPDVSHLPSGSYLPAGGNHIGEGSRQFGSISGIGHQTDFGNIGQSSFGGISGQSGFNTGSQDQKHVYFYSAPEDESSSRLRIQITPNSQRNTKIIFVKAPSYGSLKPEIIAPQSLSEDKTLVYVLVKRPGNDGVINIPAGAGVKPGKPEVYFVNYKTQQDAQQQIAGGLQGQQVGSHVTDLGNEADFIRLLDSGVAAGSSGGHTVGSVGSHSSGSHQIGHISSNGIGLGNQGHHGSGNHAGLQGSGSNIFATGASGSGQYGPAGGSGPY